MLIERIKITLQLFEIAHYQEKKTKYFARISIENESILLEFVPPGEVEPILQKANFLGGLSFPGRSMNYSPLSGDSIAQASYERNQRTL
jgi:hypothetical protein